MFTGRGQAEGALPVQGLEATHPHHVQGLRPAQNWGSVQRSSQVNLKSTNSLWDASQTTSLHWITELFFWQEGVPEKCTSEGYSCNWHDHHQGTSSQEGPFITDSYIVFISIACSGIWILLQSLVHELHAMKPWYDFRASKTCRRLSTIGSRSPTSCS